MKAVLRNIVAIAAGLVVVLTLVIAVELFSSVVHPLPADFGGTQDEMCQHVERYPPWVLGVVVPLWGFAAFAGAWVARRTGSLASGVIVGLLTIAAVVFNMSMLPYPPWFVNLNLSVIPVAVILGCRPLSRREPAQV